MSREDNIKYMFESDRIWPPVGFSAKRQRFMVALGNVLKRLPDDAFEHVEDCIDFIVDDIDALALNVPFSRTFPAAGEVTISYDQIIVFRTAFLLSDEALVGLVAHEIAHSIVCMDNHAENEAAADATIEKWGFGEELAQLEKEKRTSVFGQTSG
jgi:hypothetical protein